MYWLPIVKNLKREYKYVKSLLRKDIVMKPVATKTKGIIKKIPLLNSIARKIYYKIIISGSKEKNDPSITQKQQPRELIYLGNNKALTRTIWGQKMFLDTRDISITPHILLDGFWEMWITKVFVETIKEGMTVVEIGANMGYYTLLAASIIGPSGKLYAFEGNSTVYECLLQSVAVNGFLDRVTLVNKVASGKSGKMKFHKLKQLQGATSISSREALFKFHKYADQIETVEVETVSLDDYFNGYNPNIDLIKIDAEGSEALIFQGMKKLLQENPHVTIICEFTPDLISGTGENPKQFLEAITEHGFKLRIINTDSNLEEVSIDKLLNMHQCELFLSRTNYVL